MLEEIFWIQEREFGEIMNDTVLLILIFNFWVSLFSEYLAFCSILPQLHVMST